MRERISSQCYHSSLEARERYEGFATAPNLRQQYYSISNIKCLTKYGCLGEVSHIHQLPDFMEMIHQLRVSRRGI